MEVSANPKGLFSYGDLTENMADYCHISADRPRNKLLRAVLASELDCHLLRGSSIGVQISRSQSKTPIAGMGVLLW
jgi:hypothetical protein